MKIFIYAVMLSSFILAGCPCKKKGRGKAEPKLYVTQIEETKEVASLKKSKRNEKGIA